MKTCEHLILLAAYNASMNQKVYDAAATLPEHEVMADRKAFFGSIFGTLNHIIAGDTIWLTRFATHPARHGALDALRGQTPPTSLTASAASDLAGLYEKRRQLDAIITQWAAQLSEADLDHVLHYASTKGVPSQKRYGDLALHFFNHQTHHRGQASTLLFQAGVDIGVTDLLVLIPNT